MKLPSGETELVDIRVGFDRRLELEFHGSHITSDAGLLPFRDLDDALGLTEIAATALSDIRTGKNGRHSFIVQFRQSPFGRIAGYEDVNDADRLAKDAAMRWIVGGRAITNHAASTSQMARFGTEVLTQNGVFSIQEEHIDRSSGESRFKQARTSFLKKSSKKLLVHWGRTNRPSRFILRRR